MLCSERAFQRVRVPSGCRPLWLLTLRRMSERTRVELVIWGRGASVGESLAAELLKNEGFLSIDPTHPKGGPDGAKDLLCERLGVKYVVACFFPNNSHHVTFAQLKKKFRKDLKGVERNDAKGFIFFTNVEVTDGNRDKLKDLARGSDAEKVHIYHLERVRELLDSPISYGVRLKHLELSMANEELIAFFQDVLTREHARLRDELIEVRQQIARLLPPAATSAQVVQALSSVPAEQTETPGAST